MYIQGYYIVRHPFGLGAETAGVTPSLASVGVTSSCAGALLPKQVSICR